jgi:spore maturation protein CgeB
MNILYFYHEYGGRRKKYGEIMKALGHKVKYYKIKIKMKKGKIPTRKLTGIDLIWTLSTFYNYYGAIDEEFIKEAKRRGILFVTYTTISIGTPLREWTKSYEPYDYVFLQNKELVKRINQRKVMYMPLGFYPEQYYPNKKQNKYLVSFVGSPQTTVPPEQDLRCQILQAVAQKYDLIIYGKKFANRIKGVPIRAFQTHKQQRNVYNSTLINLDIPFINSPLPEYRNMMHLKNRFFEIPACKSFLLCGRSPEAENILKDGFHCAYYDDIEDLLEKIQYYSKNPKRAQEIAEQGYLEVIKKHTFRHRFEDMFNIIISS